MASSPKNRGRPLGHLPVPNPPELTSDDWELILQALDAYRHHAAFRAVHGKIAACQGAPWYRTQADPARATV